jgi:hypothetical protein
MLIIIIMIKGLSGGRGPAAGSGEKERILRGEGD